jgi:hypothetical protein
MANTKNEDKKGVWIKNKVLTTSSNIRKLN